MESLLPSKRQYRPFHVAFPVHDIAQARAFYGDLLACPEGRSAPDWVDFDLFGHQIVAHLAPQECGLAATNGVDGDQVPVRHFGVVLDMTTWQDLAQRLKDAGQRFIVDPTCAFKDRLVSKPPCSFLIPQAMLWSSRPLLTSINFLLGEQKAESSRSGRHKTTTVVPFLPLHRARHWPQPQYVRAGHLQSRYD